MSNLNHSMRPKVKGDTYFLPDSNGGVYFRNNEGSFRMEGGTISQWIEKLIPAFNGDHTLQDLTDGLPDQYGNQVYEITEVLYKNGFVRDVSQDRPHQLPDALLQRYAPQIEFLDTLCNSAAYRFQSYRQTKVLAVGAGPFLVSLVAALFESGLPKVHVLVTDSIPTNRHRLVELAAHARKTDPEVALEEITLHKEGVSAWREIVQPFQSVLYVSQESDVDQLRVLHTACREEKKVLLPAMCLQQVGMAGPLVHPNSGACWESAWRRMHQSAVCRDSQVHTFSSTAGAMLANVIVFELLKTVTGVTESELKNQFFLLDFVTLEGNFHSFMPHPLVTGHASAEWVQDLEQRIEQSSGRSKSNELLPFLSMMTSAESGIFHIWEEGDLKQLPLAQCRVQVTDPLSRGPAELLPGIVCTGLTHDEARREAGLTGIEAYVSRMVDLLVTTLPEHQEDRLLASQDFVGVGAGQTVAQGVCRGLQKCLAEALREQHVNQMPVVFRVTLNKVEDELCQFYLKALTTMEEVPEICLGQEVFGIPVAWVGTSGRWYGSVGFNVTMALRQALQQVLLIAQNEATCLTTQVLEVPSVYVENKVSQGIVITLQEAPETEVLQSALHVLQRNRKRLLVLELAVEPFFKEELAGVFGVLLREEESR